MHRFLFFFLTIAGCFSWTLPSSTALADLIFTVQRVSDTEVRVSASGSVGGAATTFEALYLESIGNGTGVGTTAGNFVLGGYDVTGWVALVDDISLTASGGTFTNVDVPSGSETLSGIAGFTFASVGSSGIVTALPFGGGSGDIRAVGTWTMIAAVPEPSCGSLFGLALFGLFRRSRRRAPH